MFLLNLFNKSKNTMKKLTLNKSNFSVKEVLSKAQLKKIMGGESFFGDCSVTYTTPSDPTPQTISYSVGGTCAQQSNSIRELCVNNITVGTFATCRYDCGCDGWGS